MLYFWKEGRLVATITFLIVFYLIDIAFITS